MRYATLKRLMTRETNKQMFKWRVVESYDSEKKRFVMGPELTVPHDLDTLPEGTLVHCASHVPGVYIILNRRRKRIGFGYMAQIVSCPLEDRPMWLVANGLEILYEQ